MNFRGIELEFDIFEADAAEDYEKAIAVVAGIESEVLEGETWADNIRRQCAGVFDFFDALFGEGFHKELFGSSTNLRECRNAFKEFTDMVAVQLGELAELQDVAQNRQARRVAGKKEK